MSAGACIELAHATDLAGFRRATRGLIAAGAPPDAVRWRVVGDAHTAGLFDTALDAPAADDNAAPLRLPRAFVQLAELLVRHRADERFALLYRLAWRLTHEPALRGDALDADWLHAQRLAKEVRRAIHHLHAYVRFRPLAAGGGGPVQHLAWFEPPHRVLDVAAPFFVRRLANDHWAIVTPEASVQWRPGGPLVFGPGGLREDVPASDAGDACWLTYYAHTFNPARLKLEALQRQMPRGYWPNLPEAQLIEPLARQARRLTSGDGWLSLPTGDR